MEYDLASFVVTPCTIGGEHLLLACMNSRAIDLERELANDQPTMEVDYVRCVKPPHYQLPCLLGTVYRHGYCVVIATADDELPGITWWDESCDLPLPYDHGKWNPN